VKNIFLFLKSQSVHKVLVGLLAVFLLTTNIACSNSKVMAKAEKPDVENQPTGQITELYKPIVPNKGGMNGYSDIDPRMDTSQADAKADRLIKQANRQRRNM
jgi:hypothetical protein